MTPTRVYVTLADIRPDVRRKAAARLARKEPTLLKALTLMLAAENPVENPGVWVDAEAAWPLLDRKEAA